MRKTSSDYFDLKIVISLFYDSSQSNGHSADCPEYPAWNVLTPNSGMSPARNRINNIHSKCLEWAPIHKVRFTARRRNVVCLSILISIVLQRVCARTSWAHSIIVLPAWYANYWDQTFPIFFLKKPSCACISTCM